MNAQRLAAELAKHGINAQRIAEPQLHEDGAIYLTDQVHVQVPLYGNDPNVVRETINGEFEFGAARQVVTELVADIQDALRDAAAEATQARQTE